MDFLHEILLLLLGGVNIFQLIFYRIQRDKMKAEAEKLKALAEEEKVNAKHKGLDLMQDQADYLLNQLNTIQNEYIALQTKLREELANHTATINQKCNELAELKSKLIYFKGLRCYKSDCSCRISMNPKDGDASEKENVGNKS